MKSLGLDCRSGIATAAISLPVFFIGFCVLLPFTSSSLPALFSALTVISLVSTAILAVLQCVWTKKTYIKRLQKTTRALEEISLGKTPAQLAKERYVLCSDIKQCPEDHTIMDCLACELYAAQNDLEKLGAIVTTLGCNINQQQPRTSSSSSVDRNHVIELFSYANVSSNSQNHNGGFIRCDSGYKKPDET